MAQSVGASSTSVTVAALVDDWWASGPRLAPSTRLNYRSNLDAHILPVLGETKVEDVRPRLVAAFLRHLQQDKGLGGGTARKVRTVLSAVFSYAVAMEYVESNPVMKVPPPEVEDTERVAPTIEETARILLAAERDDPEFLTYLWVAAEEGGRRGETLGLRWKCIDFEGAELSIEATVSRGEDGVQVRQRTKSKKPRRVAVSPITLALLAEHRRLYEVQLRALGRFPRIDPEGLVFSGGQGSRRHPLDGKPWRPDSTSRRFARLKENAGVRSDIDLHGLRHTMITELLAAGVDPRTVMGRAGHASEATTMKLYAKVRPSKDAAAASLWGEMLNKKMQELRGTSA
jgi:integrase